MASVGAGAGGSTAAGGGAAAAGATAAAGAAAACQSSDHTKIHAHKNDALVMFTVAVRHCCFWTGAWSDLARCLNEHTSNQNRPCPSEHYNHAILMIYKLCSFVPIFGTATGPLGIQGVDRCQSTATHLPQGLLLLRCKQAQEFAKPPVSSRTWRTVFP